MTEYWDSYEETDDERYERVGREMEAESAPRLADTVVNLMKSLQTQNEELSEALTQAISTETEQHKTIESLQRRVQYLEEKLETQKKGVRDAVFDEIACEFEREREPHNAMKLLREENAKLRAEIKKRNKFSPLANTADPYDQHGFDDFPSAMTVAIHQPTTHVLTPQEHFGAEKSYDMHRAEEIYSVMMTRPENSRSQSPRLAARYSSVPLATLPWAERQQAAREIVNGLTPLLYKMVMAGAS